MELKPEDIGVEHILENPGEPRAMLESLLLDQALELGAPSSIAAVLSWKRMADYLIDTGLVTEKAVRPVYLRERLGVRGTLKVSSVGKGGPMVKVGDRVAWRTNRVEATGRVVARVPAGLPVERTPGFPALVDEFGAFTATPGVARTYLSWLVMTEDPPGLHWPLPVRLEVEA